VDESFFSNSTSLSIDAFMDEDDEDEAEDYDGGIIDEASISQLSKTFNAPASTYSNREVREMYIEAKEADQQGDRERSKSVLKKLREATPHDMRVVRRLANGTGGWEYFFCKRDAATCIAVGAGECSFDARPRSVGTPCWK
jgi:hypothetical protein